METENNSLTIFTKASVMLAEADTIQKARELKSLALTAADWAKRKGLGEEAIKYCRSYALEAERKMGEMLLATERQRPGEYQRLRDDTVAPSLSSLGLTKRESAEAQVLASIPREEFEKVSSGKKSRERLRKEIKTEKRNERISEREKKAENNQTQKVKFTLIHSSIENLSLPEKSVDAIITDPPYGKEYVSLYKNLSLLASKVLKAGAPCLVMTGQSHLEEILHNLSEHLSYQWTLAYLTPGSSVQVFGRKIKSNWKPIIFLTNGKNEWEHVDDVIKSDESDKRFHEWGQSISGMISIISRFTVKKHTILDPFCGGGSTGVACLLTDRLFIGADCSEDEINHSKERISAI